MDEPEEAYTSYQERETPEEGQLFVQMVRHNYDGFTKCEIEKAILDCKAQGMMGSPSDDAVATMSPNKT
eukprot:CCRYP_002679-RA/>CCRYP_002679-RA protein AED:0.46 eAED:0.46 QI:0/0/0/1/1/1/2/0/68